MGIELKRGSAYLGAPEAVFKPRDVVQEAGAGHQQEGEATAGANRGDPGDEEDSGRHLQLEQEQRTINIRSLLRVDLEKKEIETYYA